MRQEGYWKGTVEDLIGIPQKSESAMVTQGHRKRNLLEENILQVGQSGNSKCMFFCYFTSVLVLQLKANNYGF